MRLSLERLVLLIASLTLFLLMLLVVVDVAGRNLIGQPVKGATELAEILLVTITFLALPVVGWQEKHIVVDLIPAGERRLMKFSQHVLGGAAGAVLFGVASWRLWALAGNAQRYGDIMPSLGLPVALTIYFISVASGVTALVFILTIPRGFRR